MNMLYFLCLVFFFFNIHSTLENVLCNLDFLGILISGNKGKYFKHIELLKYTLIYIFRKVSRIQELSLFCFIVNF